MPYTEDKSQLNFEEALTNLINEHSKENESDTPDFILADYINDCLEAFKYAVRKREQWHGRQAKDETII